MSEPLRRVPHPPVDERVRVAQQLLRAAGARIQPDGRFGFGTELATIAFQRKHQLEDTGVIDDATMDALRAASAPPAAPTTTQAALQAPAPVEVPLPTVPYTTIGDSIIVGTTARLKGSVKKLDYHYRMNGKNPEMVGKDTNYIQRHLKSEVLPVVDKLGIKTLVIDGGLNDFLKPMKTQEEADAMFKAVTERIAENIRLARQAGLKVVALSLAPEGQTIEHWQASAEIKERGHDLWNRVNAFIFGLIDAPDGPNCVIDLTKVVGETQDGVARYRDPYAQKGDLLHPTAAGYDAIARKVEIAVRKLEAQ